MYGGLSITFFFLVLFLQQVAGYDALQAGLATLPTTLVMFVLSKRFGALSDRIGPRLLMGAGPLVAAAGLAWFRPHARHGRLRRRRPAGPARLLARPGDDGRAADDDRARRRRRAQRRDRVGDQQRGRARRRAAGDRGARRRRGGDVHVLARRRAARPLAVAGRRSARSPRRAIGRSPGPTPRAWRPARPARWRAPSRTPSWTRFAPASGSPTGLVALGGLLGLAGIVNPRRTVSAAGCAGGQLVGAPEEVALPRAARAGVSRARRPAARLLSPPRDDRPRRTAPWRRRGSDPKATTAAPSRRAGRRTGPRRAHRKPAELGPPVPRRRDVGAQVGSSGGGP